MEVISKKAVTAAAAVIVAMGLIGAYQGWRRSAADEAQTGADGSPLPLTAAVSGARQASALVETTPTLSEAQIRDIARQEVRASLRGDSAAASGSAPASTSAAATPATGPTAGAAPPPPRPAPAAPVTAPAPPPAAEPAPAASAPLF